MEPFKNLLGAQAVHHVAKHLARADPRVDVGVFLTHALRDLDALEMKARALQITEALEQVLPSAFPSAVERLEAMLTPITDEGGAHEDDSGLSGWTVWPLTLYVARHGLETPERALASLHAMTQRFTSEFALRAFVIHHPRLTFETLARWTRDPSEHVRRLVSEGTRPRLPWGVRLQALVSDPSPTLPLLEALRDDESEYVRRSVANHLNDISKDHPERFADLLEAWLRDATPERQRLLKHASRTLVKAGHPRVLRAFGRHHPFEGEAELSVAPRSIELGAHVELTLALTSRSERTQRLTIDYAVHHRKANGGTSPKVFKGWELELAPGASRTLVRKHAMRRITTRTYYAGEHRVECLINGQSVATEPFVLHVPD